MTRRQHKQPSPADLKAMGVSPERVTRIVRNRGVAEPCEAREVRCMSCKGSGIGKTSPVCRLCRGKGVVKVEIER